MSGAFRRHVLEVVRAVPSGKVVTYGDVATLAGSARAARAVGSILRNTPWVAVLVPWHRVINGRGAISGGGDATRPILQRALLAAEGVVFDERDRVDLTVYRWDIREAPAFDPAPPSAWTPPEDWSDG